MNRDGSLAGGSRHIEYMDLDSIKSAKRNPKSHDIDQIMASYERFSAQDSPVLDERTKRLLSGHGRIEALKALRNRGTEPPGGVQVEEGKWLVPVQRGGRTANDAEAEAYILAANKLTELGGWDDSMLRDVLADITDFSGVGFDPPIDTEPDADMVPDVPKSPVSQPGTLWLLGDSRVLCGSSTDFADVTKVLEDDKATCMWTDPPYGVEYEGKTKDKLKIDNDGALGLGELLDGAFSHAYLHALQDGAAVYVCHPAGANSLEFYRALNDAGFKLRQALVWVKNTFALGRSDYHYRHEPIWFGYKPKESGRLGRGGDGWFGDNAQDSVFEVDKPSRNKEHPTMKPVPLIQKMLANSTKHGELVYEPFGGSGSTLIAAVKMERRCASIEIAPGYCDVIVQRWEELTGGKAKKAS